MHATLLKDDCDWITLQANVPHASHMGGMWERMIRSVRGVLASILLQHGGQLDDDLFQTFMIEAEAEAVAVVNCRSIVKKKVDLLNLLEDTHADVIVDTESWLMDAISDSEVCPIFHHVQEGSEDWNGGWCIHTDIK